jgi:uncharacterized iron-regulated protein
MLAAAPFAEGLVEGTFDDDDGGPPDFGPHPITATASTNSIPLFANTETIYQRKLELMVQVLALLLAQGVDPMNLGLGFSTEAPIGTIFDLRMERTATLADVAKAADGKRWVFLGENHATTEHQNMEAAVIEALVKRKRKVIVGLEMLTRPTQSTLDEWIQTNIAEDAFLTKIDWKKQWGFDFKFYRPVFEVSRKYKLPMVALNVPRDWVRQVGRKGFDGLTAEQKAELPASMSLDNADHRAVFTALMGGHPMTGPQGDNVYAAQVLWDEGMADTALKAREKGDKNAVFVVIAGSGHIMYNQGINYRIKKRTNETGVTLTMGQAPGPTSMVSRGLGDFVFITRSVEKEER